VRVSIKPLDISLLNAYLPKLKNYFSEVEGLNSKKIIIKFDLLKNHINFSFGQVQLFEYNNLTNISVANVSVSLIASEFFKKNILIDYINISNGSFDLTLNKNSEFTPEKFIKNLKLKKINFNDININYYHNNKKIAYANGISGAFQKKDQQVLFENISVEFIDYYNFYNGNNIKINNLNLESKNYDIISKNYEKYFLSTKKVVIFKDDGIFESAYTKQINKLILEDIKTEYFLKNNELISNGKIIYEGQESLINIKGYYEYNNFASLSLGMKLIDFPLLSLIKPSVIDESFNYSESFLKLNFSGNVQINIDENKFNIAKFNLHSNVEDNNNYKVLDKNYGTLINLKEIFLEGSIKNNFLEIDNFFINSEEGSINLSGEINNFSREFDYDINLRFNDYDYIKLSQLASNFINFKEDESIYFKKINNATISDLRLNIKSLSSNFVIDSFYAEIIDIKYTYNKNLIFHAPKLELTKNNKKLFANSSDIKVFGAKNNIYLNSFSINFSTFNNLENLDSFDITTNMKSDYSSIYQILKEVGWNKASYMDIKNLNGDLEGQLNLKYVLDANNKKKLNYNFVGTLKNFNFVNLNKNNEKIFTLNNFKGNIKIENNLTEIKGFGLLNNSYSELKIKLDNEFNLLANVNSDADAKSFSFLKSYNFIEDGTTKFKMKIAKKFDSKEWTAEIKTNLFANTINLDFLEYEKEKNVRAELSGILYFKENNLKSIKSMKFYSEDILFDSNVIFDEDMEIKKVDIKEFISSKNNIYGSVDFKEDTRYFNLKGNSIDIKEFLTLENKKSNNLIFELDVSNLFYGDLVFGKSQIITHIINNKIDMIEGKVLLDDKPYLIITNDNKQNNDFLKVTLTFEDFGTFLRNSQISDAFIKGFGNIDFELDKSTLEVLNGKVNISETSIKNASFLARLLQLASFTGLLEILTNEGIPITKIEGDFQIKDKIISLNNIKIKGFSLGGSVEGNVFMDNKDIDLKGVIVPAYAINAFINKIPVIGQVITGIEGEGLIGVNYTAKGTYEEPEYTINPLSVLTPGIIRSIFDVFLQKENKNIENTK